MGKKFIGALAVVVLIVVPVGMFLFQRPLSNNPGTNDSPNDGTSNNPSTTLKAQYRAVYNETGGLDYRLFLYNDGRYSLFLEGVGQSGGNYTIEGDIITGYPKRGLTGDISKIAPPWKGRIQKNRIVIFEFSRGKYGSFFPTAEIWEKVEEKK